MNRKVSPNNDSIESSQIKSFIEDIDLLLYK